MSHSNAKLKDNLDLKRKGQLIQFSPYSTELSQLLENDVKLSGYKTKTKYFNVLTGKVLSLERRFESRSCIDELFRILALIERLPIERIQRLALTQHRNFDQMLTYLILTALNDYPDLTSLECAALQQRTALEKDAMTERPFNG